MEPVKKSISIAGDPIVARALAAIADQDDEAYDEGALAAWLGKEYLLRHSCHTFPYVHLFVFVTGSS